MTQIDRDPTPSDLVWVAEQLRRERPKASPLELDRMKLQARAQATRGTRSQPKGNFLKSRVAITAILMLGLLTGGTGTTLALSGGSHSAAQNQYAGERAGDTNVLGVTERGGQGGAGQPGGGDSVQGSRQAVATESGGSNLPFTGLAAVPLIVLGLALIGAGAMLYRSTRGATSAA